MSRNSRIDPVRILQSLPTARRIVDSKLYKAAWGMFRRQPWEPPMDPAVRSDPTYCAVAFLEGDDEYQAARRLVRYVENLPPRKRAIAEAIARNCLHPSRLDPVNKQVYDELLREVEALFTVPEAWWYE